MLIAHMPIITIRGIQYHLKRAAKTKEIADKLCNELNDNIKKDQTIFIDHAIVRHISVNMRHAVMPGANWGIFVAYTPRDQIKDGKRMTKGINKK